MSGVRIVWRRLLGIQYFVSHIYGWSFAVVPIIEANILGSKIFSQDLKYNYISIENVICYQPATLLVVLGIPATNRLTSPRPIDFTGGSYPEPRRLGLPCVPSLVELKTNKYNLYILIVMKM